MAKISQNTIDLIKNTADIVDVVSEFVPLQRAGKNMKGLCPFHNEKTPSFFVSKERQIFNCFGCGEKGNAITFIQKYKHLSFVESLKYLADKYHIPVELDETNTKQNTSKNLYKANELALNYYTLNLLNMDLGTQALGYLHKRGFDNSLIEEFKLGFAPDKFSGLFDQLKSEYQPLDLLNVGLINKNESGTYYDLFRNRIMVPIQDESGRVIAFSGRVFGNNDNPAKYVNTPHTELFHKGKILYNLHKALPFIKSNNRIILMEGYFDVIKAAKFGVREVVCSMGTQLTIDQALLIKNYTDNVLIIYDGDHAGRVATFKALKLLEQAKLNVKIVLMPDGLDPDEYMNQHSDFSYQVDHFQIDQYDFVYKTMIEGKDLTKPAEIENIKNKLFDYFKSTSGMIREIYLQKFASDTLVNYDTLLKDYQNYLVDNRIMMDYHRIVKQQKAIKIKKPKYKQAERTILNYYIYDESYREKIDDRFNLLTVKDKDIFFILETIRALRANIGNKNPLVLLRNDLSEDYRKKLELLLLRKNYDYNIEDFDQCIRQLEIQKLEDQIDDFNTKAKVCKENDDNNGYVKYRQEALEIDKKIKKLEGKNNDKKSNY
ncbi:DNA primase [Candidatus Izemoplasma sp. B36]|uniref:DNA primase n=1 Tax=Candidatus Izemoplasma sp. B36 TaxID=3242468 RepID=UPI00355684B7